MIALGHRAANTLLVATGEKTRKQLGTVNGRASITKGKQLLYPKYYGWDIRIRTGQEGIGNSSHGLRTAYRDRATDTVGARLVSTDSVAPGGPWAKYRRRPGKCKRCRGGRQPCGHHKQDKQSEGKRERKELQV